MPQNTAKLLPRQRVLLELLASLGGTIGKLDFQKLLFLYCQEPQLAAPLYDFVPYKFGAFSFTSYADWRKLVERGLLEEGETWSMTSAGERAIGRTRDTRVAAFATRSRQLRGDALVAETYRRFPYYAIRSEIAERVLADDATSLKRIAAVKAKSTGSVLSTIGYEGHSLEGYLNTLVKKSVTVLCDVRRNPISRKYGFSKNTLARGCEGVGIRYEHIPELGIASDQRQSLETQADYDALFEEYERTWLPGQDASIDRIATWIRGGERVTLTCYEHLPSQCHRHCVAEVLEHQLGKEIHAKHL